MDFSIIEIFFSFRQILNVFLDPFGDECKKLIEALTTERKPLVPATVLPIPPIVLPNLPLLPVTQTILPSAVPIVPPYEENAVPAFDTNSQEADSRLFPAAKPYKQEKEEHAEWDSNDWDSYNSLHNSSSGSRKYREEEDDREYSRRDKYYDRKDRKEKDRKYQHHHRRDRHRDRSRERNRGDRYRDKECK